MASEPPIGPLGGDFTDESDEDGSEYDYPTGGRGGGGGGGGMKSGGRGLSGRLSYLLHKLLTDWFICYLVS